MFGVLANIGEEYAHLRRSEKDLGSEVVFRMDDEWSIEFGPHWFDVAHVMATHLLQFFLAVI